MLPLDPIRHGRGPALRQVGEPVLSPELVTGGGRGEGYRVASSHYCVRTNRGKNPGSSVSGSTTQSDAGTSPPQRQRRRPPSGGGRTWRLTPSWQQTVIMPNSQPEEDQAQDGGGVFGRAQGRVGPQLIRCRPEAAFQFSQAV